MTGTVGLFCFFNGTPQYSIDRILGYVRDRFWCVTLHRLFVRLSVHSLLHVFLLNKGATLVAMRHYSTAGK
jgi:hypothetical protein